MPLNWFSKQISDPTISYSGFLRPGKQLSDSPPRILSSDIRSGLYPHFQVMTFLVTKPKPNFFFAHFCVLDSVFVPFILWIVQTHLLLNIFGHQTIESNERYKTSLWSKVFSFGKMSMSGNKIWESNSFLLRTRLGCFCMSDGSCSLWVNHFVLAHIENISSKIILSLSFWTK